MHGALNLKVSIALLLARHLCPRSDFRPFSGADEGAGQDSDVLLVGKGHRISSNA